MVAACRRTSHAKCEAICQCRRFDWALSLRSDLCSMYPSFCRITKSATTLTMMMHSFGFDNDQHSLTIFLDFKLLGLCLMHPSHVDYHYLTTALLASYQRFDKLHFTRPGYKQQMLPGISKLVPSRQLVPASKCLSSGTHTHPSYILSTTPYSPTGMLSMSSTSERQLLACSSAYLTLSWAQS